MTRVVTVIAAIALVGCDPTATNRPPPASPTPSSYPTPASPKRHAEASPPVEDSSFKPNDAAIEAYIASHKKLSEETKKDLRAHEIRIGMTAEEVELIYGPPDKINRSGGSWGVHEQWVYENGDGAADFLYFENGKFTSWQD